MAIRPIDGNVLIEWFRPYLHTGEAIPADVVIENIRSMPTLTPPNEPEHAGLYGKYTVYKNKDGSLVTDCFILRPAKDPAAVAALRAYAAATDNAELAADIINWVGAKPNEALTLDQLREMDGNPTWCEEVGKWALVSVSDAGKWKGIPFALFEENGARFEWNIEGRELSLYSSPPTQQWWIPVSERLPDDEKDGETVLAVVSGKPHENITLCYALMTAGYFPGEGWVVNEYPEWENPTITHWMPLPELPEEDLRDHECSGLIEE